MTAFSNIIADPQFLIMYAIAFVLLYLGIKMNEYDMTAFSNIIADPQFLIMYAIAFVLLYMKLCCLCVVCQLPGGDMGDSGRREWYGNDKRSNEEYLGNAFT